MRTNRKPVLVDKRQLLDVHELSHWLRVSVNTIYGYVNQRKIPCLKVNGALRFDVKDIEKWLEKQKVKAMEF
jgi:excisionase family DNA binding protein